MSLQQPPVSGLRPLASVSLSHGGFSKAAPINAPACSDGLGAVTTRVNQASFGEAGAASVAAASLGAAAGVLVKVLHKSSRRQRPQQRSNNFLQLHVRGRVQRAAAAASGDGRLEDDASLSEDLVVGPGFSGSNRKTGVLLLNIGTPASTSVEDVRSYLSRFLSDDRVIEIEPWWLKALLLQLLLATRPASSAENYKKIWDPIRGSPLLYHSQDLAQRLQEELGDSFAVRIGFAYSEPFVEDAFRSLAAEGVDDVALVPMFPHYASSTTGSILENVYKSAADLFCTPFLKVVPPFYIHPEYIACVRRIIEETLTPDVEHLVFSFHGLPESQCSRTDETQSVCLRTPNCCAMMRQENRNCYRAQCYETARVLAKQLGLVEGTWSVAFQSRLTLRGRIQWIRPYTDEVIEDLAKRGAKKIAVVAPSFTADCVETLEELGISGREEFEEAGGEELVLVPCLNSSQDWVKGLAGIVREQLAGTGGLKAVAVPLAPEVPSTGSAVVVNGEEVVKKK